jgi:hypothetical protein
MHDERRVAKRTVGKRFSGRPRTLLETGGSAWIWTSFIMLDARRKAVIRRFMSRNEDSANPGSHAGSDTPTAEELAGWFIRNLADEVTAWQNRLPAIQPFVSRYMRTSDFAELTVLACSADSEDDMERAVENSIIIPAFTIIGNSDASLPVRPSLVAGTFDTRTEAIVQAGILANRMNELYGAPEPEEPEERALWEIVHDDDYVPMKRTRVPEPAADGFEIYVFSALLYRNNPGETDEVVTTFIVSPPPGPCALLHVPAMVMKGQPAPRLGITDYKQAAAPQAKRPATANRVRSSARRQKPAGSAIWKSKWFWILAAFLLIGLLNRMVNGPTDKNRRDSSGEKAPAGREPAE